MDAGASLLERAAGVLSPLGRLMGLDGMVLLAFLLGFPPMRSVLPILLMGYLHTGTLTECGGLEALWAILLHSGWTTETALCARWPLCLLHFPCGTTCLTIRRETGGCRWTLLAMVLPTAVGMAVCMFGSMEPSGCWDKRAKGAGIASRLPLQSGLHVCPENPPRLEPVCTPPRRETILR